ncbi:3D-(3,5/4)-trihydroxycyclohexane-1,2-dione acylhydrolase (decyclizing) [Vallitalea okinawensis]|uniref:3D-(3,5/4)-trihydroxycyclohexane-1,2-dione acylhydrolase (decyclizing) n=1 Tax=Vallitalea okinawensis TaxID=2078660 RepID=UPI000CFB5DA7|nr:3D-(3,5/4)-trihydroxycyclohexane-1,2-dione acylhydrolase (decyclizing) [Vallitalea okinawensis]
MKTRKLTTAQALLEFLDNQYIEVDGVETKFVKGVMGIFGHGNVVGLGQALDQYKDRIKYYAGKNEQEIAHVAVAYAKQKRRKEIFACTASIGPGSLNMVTAAGTASVNRIPLLLLPSDAYSDRQPDPVLQQVEQQYDPSITANDAFRSVSKYWDRIQRPEQLMSSAINAIRVLTNPAETGAVTLCLPQDVQGESYNYPESFFKKRVHRIRRIDMDAYDLEQVTEIIKDKKKPLVICGGGVRYSDAEKELVDFCETFNIPFSETQAGKGIIPWNHSLNLGGGGVCGTLAANRLAKEADVIIAVGTRLNDFVTSSKFAYQNPDVDLITININNADAYKMNATSIVADAKKALISLKAALEDINYTSTYTNEIHQAKADWDQELEKMDHATREDGFCQTAALYTINQTIDQKSIIVSASGSLPSDLERVWRPTEPDTYHLEYGFSCMGYEVSGALGTKLAEPSVESYCFVGDGGFLMGHSDLFTSLQEDQKINVLLFDNNGHQCIHNLQRSQGINTFGTEFRYRDESGNALLGDYTTIDFAKIAEGYGAVSYRVTNREELIVALNDAKKQTKSTLIDIKVLPGTMTGGFEHFWRVGTAQVADDPKVEQAAIEMNKKVSTRCFPY